ncbi:MAG TPA: hypothetical protein VFQ72_02335 [Candidatus Paceibacterota bacterium]|nr:hypothetical protein [Candidatus Paceibacterota bacterium]
MSKARRRRIAVDGAIILASVVAAVALARSPLVDALFAAVSGQYILAALVAGALFTSSFTTAPAIVFLSKLLVAFPPLHIAAAAAVGALAGDLVLFLFVKSHVAEDISYLLSRSNSRRALRALRLHSVRWLMTAVGALVIASPLPDELGLALMGVSKISTWKFCLLSLTFNFLGVLLIAFVARSAVGL